MSNSILSVFVPMREHFGESFLKKYFGEEQDSSIIDKTIEVLFPHFKLLWQIHQKKENRAILEEIRSKTCDKAQFDEVVTTYFPSYLSGSVAVNRDFLMMVFDRVVQGRKVNRSILEKVSGLYDNSSKKLPQIVRYAVEDQIALNRYLQKLKEQNVQEIPPPLRPCLISCMEMWKRYGKNPDIQPILDQVLEMDRTLFKARGVSMEELEAEKEVFMDQIREAVQSITSAKEKATEEECKAFLVLRGALEFPIYHKLAAISSNSQETFGLTKIWHETLTSLCPEKKKSSRSFFFSREKALPQEIYREGLKNREWAKEAPQIFWLERGALPKARPEVRTKNMGTKPTPAKTDCAITSGIRETRNRIVAILSEDPIHEPIRKVEDLGIREDF